VVLVEEERFAATLKVALGEFEKAARAVSDARLPGAAAFKLYDTYGLPLDLIEDFASDRGLAVDREGFERELEAQRERAARRAGSAPSAAPSPT